MHAVRRSVEADQDRQAQRRLVLLEHAVQGGAQLEPQFGPYQIDHIAVQRPAGGLDVAAGVSDRCSTRCASSTMMLGGASLSSAGRWAAASFRAALGPAGAERGELARAH